MSSIFVDVLRHFFEKAEKELKKFQKKTGWSVELMAYLRRDADTFVATRNVDGLLEVVSQEEFLGEEYEEYDEEEEDDDGDDETSGQAPPNH